MKKKCNIAICKAACCYNVPLEKGYLTAYRKKIVNPVIKMIAYADTDDIDGYDKIKTPMGLAQYLMVTDNDGNMNKCPFLRADCKCNIYESRPPICRRYGFSSERLMNCEYLSGHKTDMSLKAWSTDGARLLTKVMKGERIL